MLIRWWFRKGTVGGTEFKWAELSNSALIIPSVYSLLWFAKTSAGAKDDSCIWNWETDIRIDLYHSGKDFTPTTWKHPTVMRNTVLYLQQPSEHIVNKRIILVLQKQSHAWMRIRCQLLDRINKNLSETSEAVLPKAFYIKLDSIHTCRALKALIAWDKAIKGLANLFHNKIMFKKRNFLPSPRRVTHSTNQTRAHWKTTGTLNRDGVSDNYSEVRCLF